MANFITSFNETIAFEGGYVNNPNDNGGETYRGISRNNFPKWKGWVIVDQYKKAPFTAKSMNQVLNNNHQLQVLVQDFYKANFWTPIVGDNIVNQDVANNIYDFAVNSGVGRAVRYAQRIVGATEDGVMGNVTITAINHNANFVSIYKKARLDFLNKIVANNPSQKVFLAGWTSRVNNA